LFFAYDDALKPFILKKMFAYLCTVLCPAQEFFTYMEASSLLMKGAVKFRFIMLGAQGL
jgi:hypothetical protein